MAKLNVVLIVSDDHGREALGCYGNSVVKTPHLDSLAQEGIRFTHSCCTTASCAASRSVIMTGLHNHVTGTYGHTHSVHHFACFDGVRTLPMMLQEGGYATGRVGKMHWAPKSLFPFDWEMPEQRFGRDDVAMSESCRQFIRGAEPFFLYWASHNPHRAKMLENHPLRPNGFGNPSQSFPGDEEQLYSEDEVIIPPFLPDIPAVRAELAQYYQSISRLDRGVGRLIEILKAEGKYDNTVVIYIADNGAAFPQAKTTLYEPGMRLPCIARHPLLPNRGDVCDALISWADLAPTILDLAEIEYDPAAFHGKSFLPVMSRDTSTGWRDEIYASHTFHEITNYYPMRVIRTQKHKFIWNIAWKLDYSFSSDLWAAASWQGAMQQGVQKFGARSVDAYIHRPEFELYDLEADPDEVHNLAYIPDYQPMVDELKEKLKQFQADTKDPWIHKWTYQ